MPKTKRAKMRGKRTYGYGSHKKHRNSGSRGGVGYGGAFKHKRGMLKMHEPEHFQKKKMKSLQKRGFKPAGKGITVRELAALAKGKKDIDVSQHGFSKVIGTGRINFAVSVTAPAFTASAKEKIEKAGGKCLQESEPEKAKVEKAIVN